MTRCRFQNFAGNFKSLSWKVGVAVTSSACAELNQPFVQLKFLVDNVITNQTVRVCRGMWCLCCCARLLLKVSVLHSLTLKGGTLCRHVRCRISVVCLTVPRHCADNGFSMKKKNPPLSQSNKNCSFRAHCCSILAERRADAIEQRALCWRAAARARRFGVARRDRRRRRLAQQFVGRGSCVERSGRNGARRLRWLHGRWCNVVFGVVVVEERRCATDRLGAGRWRERVVDDRLARCSSRLGGGNSSARRRRRRSSRRRATKHAAARAHADFRRHLLNFDGTRHWRCSRVAVCTRHNRHGTNQTRD